MKHFRKIISRDARWLILPGKLQSPGAYHNIYEKTYDHWRKMWVEILDSGNKTKSDNFIRQDLLCPLLINDNVVGLIGCNFFNLDQKASYDHSFISAFPKEFFANEDKGTLVMSIEYLSVLPEFRKNTIGFSVGDILLSLSMKIFENSRAKYVYGTARKKINVDDRCFRLGFEEIGEVDRFGLYCSLIRNSKESLKPHPDKDTQLQTEEIWAKREQILGNDFIFKDNITRRVA